MADILQIALSNVFLWEMFYIVIQILLNVVPKIPIYNMSELVQVMAWCRPLQSITWTNNDTVMQICHL